MTKALTKKTDLKKIHIIPSFKIIMFHIVMTGLSQIIVL